MANTNENPTPLLKLNRYLYLLSEEPRYVAGEPHVHKCFEKDKLTSIDKLIAAEKTESILPTILQAAQDPLLHRKDGVIFALATCTRSNVKTLQTQAYAALKDICKTPDELFLFVKFFIKLSEHKGFGAGFRKCILRWYLSHEPMALADMVTRVRGRCGWKHKDLMQMIHIKSPETAAATVITYVMRGIADAEAKSEFPGAPDVLEHFKLVETFKHDEDTLKLAQMIEKHNLKLDHVPGPFLKNSDIWLAVIPSLPFPVLIQSLARLSNFGLLKPNSPVLKLVLTILNTPATVKASGVHPVQVFIALRDYEHNGKCPDQKKQLYLKEVEAKKTKKVAPTAPTASGDAPQKKGEVKPNDHVKNAMFKVLKQSYQNIPKADKSYMISLDVRQQMDNTCFKCGNVTAIEAGALIILSIYKTQKDAIIAVFNDRGVNIVNLDKGITIKDAVARFKNCKNGHTQFQKPFEWAEKKNKPIDVFINIYHSSKQCFQLRKELRTKPVNLRNCLENYRKNIYANAKLISINLCTHKSAIATGIPGMIDICGFNENVPKIIESVANDALK